MLSYLVVQSTWVYFSPPYGQGGVTDKPKIVDPRCPQRGLDESRLVGKAGILIIRGFNGKTQKTPTLSLT